MRLIVIFVSVAQSLALLQDFEYLTEIATVHFKWSSLEPAVMSELTSKMSGLNPFKSKGKEDDEDKGESMGSDSIGHRIFNATEAQELRVSNALRSFIADQKILSEKEAGVGSDGTTAALRALVAQPHIIVPDALTDRSHPLPEYFVSSSHNTYLLAHQLYGTSCATAYDTAIRTGSRCVEIDAWDNSDDPEEPKVTHGYTLVSHISFRLVCETIRDVFDDEVKTLKEFNAKNPTGPQHKPAPILLSLENHCDAYGQLRLVSIMKEVFADRLLSKPIRDEGTREQQGSGEHVTLAELGSKIAVIVEYHLSGEVDDSDTDSDDEEDDDEEKQARKDYKNQKKATPAGQIVPELAELGVYAQSVKPGDNSWFETEALENGPHHHLINVSESGLAKHLPQHLEPISRHNARHLMRVYPKGTRISSSNLRPVPFWGLGAQICALNWQTFGTSNQLNDALFANTDGYVLKPAALCAGGSGKLDTGRKKKLRLHVAGASDVPLPPDTEADSFKPYLTCTLFHPDNLSEDPPKRKTSPYKQHKLGFLHKGENPPATDPVWDEVLEWEYNENEMVFLRLLVKHDASWARNPNVAALAIRLSYVQAGWNFMRMLDLKGRNSPCSVLAKLDIVDA